MNIFKNIDEYIEIYPTEVQVKLQKMREAIRTAAPAAIETINYGMPTFKLNGNLVHFAGYAKHIGFYPAPSGIAAFAKELSAYKSSKGAVQFPHDKPIPYHLVKQIVEYRVKENT